MFNKFSFCFFHSGKKTAEDTIQFNLNIKCTHNPNTPKNATDPKELYINYINSTGKW